MYPIQLNLKLYLKIVPTYINSYVQAGKKIIVAEIILL